MQARTKNATAIAAPTSPTEGCRGIAGGDHRSCAREHDKRNQQEGHETEYARLDRAMQDLGVEIR